jgi:hypothetical protein
MMSTPDFLFTVSTRARLLTISESAVLGRKEPVVSARFSTQLKSPPRIVWGEAVWKENGNSVLKRFSLQSSAPSLMEHTR